MTAAKPDPASFRDPDGRVVVAGSRVLRLLSEAGAADWDVLSASAFFRTAVADSRIVATSLVEQNPESGWAAVLEHERVPVISYPFEWTFGMLRDAALLHLDLLIEALATGMTMKDGTAYNVQWIGATPTFMDVGSFTRQPDRPWPGYEQFCETFLNPLLLQAALGVDFQAWLRGSADGIAGADARRVLPLRKVARRGALRHVLLQGRSTGADRGSSSASALLSNAGFDRRVAAAMARRLRKVIVGLMWDPPASQWTSYAGDNVYSDEDRLAKGRFVSAVAARWQPGIVVDLGSNDGTYALIAGAQAKAIVAIERDHATAERLYQRLRAGAPSNVLPLVMDVASPSPSFGWRGRERPAFHQRVRPDLVLCLALVHHLVLTRRVPLSEVVAWLRSFDAPLVVEFVDREDDMVARLLANRAAASADYDRAVFESLLGQRFEVLATASLAAGRRHLYELRPR